MNRLVMIGAGVVGAAAMLGAGVVVGTKVSDQQTVVVASQDAEGPLTKQDSFLLSSFTSATAKFDQLLAQAQKGKAVGPDMTRQAVVVINVKRLASGQALKDTADATAQAMLLIGAGLTADDSGTVSEGIDAYRRAQDKVVALANELRAEKGLPRIEPSAAPSPSAS